MLCIVEETDKASRTVGGHVAGYLKLTDTKIGKFDRPGASCQSERVGACLC
jgi:hypothetical protein